MSGVEFASAIVPLVIVLVEHHRTVFRKGMALTLSRISNDQQLDFYQDLHGELTLLSLILERVQSKAASVRHSADDFQAILERILKSINDLVREKSSALTKEDTVSTVP
jgi:hypothetical protein